MSGTEIFQILTELERSLHRCQTSKECKQLEKLLHPRFKEIGRSGKWYNRDEIIAEIELGDSFGAIQAENFNFMPIGTTTVLVTYKSAHLGKQGQLTRKTQRSSLWTKSSAGWQILFHQGTAVD